MQNFDFPFLIERAEKVGLENFAHFSRIKESLTEAKDMTLLTRVYGLRELKLININGRMLVDVMQYIKNDFKLRSYSLNFVSYHFLQEYKEEISQKMIRELQNTDEFTRRRLAIYCVKNAHLPIRLMTKLQVVYNMIETCRVCGIPADFLFTRG